MRIRWPVTCALALVLCSPSSWADQTPKPTWTFKADKIEKTADRTTRASGNVQVVGLDYRLTADTVTIREVRAAAGDAVELTAEGNVILTRGSERITLKRLVFKPAIRAGSFQLP
jgi:lipopolysaccharide export system protein LptA